MVLNPDGKVLTNAHVVDGATAIQVAIPARAATPPPVLGSDTADDVAVPRSRA